MTRRPREIEHLSNAPMHDNHRCFLQITGDGKEPITVEVLDVLTGEKRGIKARWGYRDVDMWDKEWDDAVIVVLPRKS